MVKKNFSLQDETAELYDVAYAERKAEKGDSYTNGAFLEDILHSYLNPRVKEVENPKMIEENILLKKELEKLKEEISNKKTGKKEAEEIVSSLREELEKTSSSLKEEEEKNLNLQVLIENKGYLKANEVIINLPEPTGSLLKETAKRLSEKYKKEVKIEDILLDMFIKYMVERKAKWFFPFVIDKEEFEAITDYKFEEIESWLKSK